MADMIPFDQRDGSLWYDGKLIPWKDAKTHVLTHGLHYGSSVFEGERIYNGKIYKLKEHTARLFFSAEELGMKIPFTQDEISAGCIAAAEAQGIKDGYLRPVAFRGSEMMAVSAQNTTSMSPSLAGPGRPISARKKSSKASVWTSRAGAVPRRTPSRCMPRRRASI
jgi:branched-chain amino acid aminotransferase